MEYLQCGDKLSGARTDISFLFLIYFLHPFILKRAGLAYARAYISGSHSSPITCVQNEKHETPSKFDEATNGNCSTRSLQIKHLTCELHHAGLVVSGVVHCHIRWLHGADSRPRSLPPLAARRGPCRRPASPSRQPRPPAVLLVVSLAAFTPQIACVSCHDHARSIRCELQITGTAPRLLLRHPLPTGTISNFHSHNLTRIVDNVFGSHVNSPSVPIPLSARNGFAIPASAAWGYPSHENLDKLSSTVTDGYMR